MFLPSVLTSSFFTSPGLVGETDGEATGEAVATGVGVATGGLTSGVFGSQAIDTATLAASNVDKRIDLLICSPCGRSRAWQGPSRYRSRF